MMKQKIFLLINIACFLIGLYNTMELTGLLALWTQTPADSPNAEAIAYHLTRVIVVFVVLIVVQFVLRRLGGGAPKLPSSSAE